MAVNFYLSSRPDKLGDCPIRVSISIKGTRLLSTTGYSINPMLWIDKQILSDGSEEVVQRVKKGCTNGKKIASKVINNRLDIINSQFGNYEEKIDHIPDVDEIINKLAAIKGCKRKKSTVQGDDTVLTLLTRYIKERSSKKQWATNTLINWNTFRNRLNKYGKTDINFFDEDGIGDFLTYLRSTCCMKEETVEMTFRELKYFLLWCLKKGYLKSDAIKDFEPTFNKIKDNQIIFLDKEELNRVYNYVIPDDGTTVQLTDEHGNKYQKTIRGAEIMRRVQDIFCLCAYTSLRYSDATKLKKSEIIGDKIITVAKKTKTKLEINLNDFSRTIINKHIHDNNPQGLVLPHVSCDKVNQYIKDIGELCGINAPITRKYYKGGMLFEEEKPKWQMMSSHTGRKTFIVNALSAGIDPVVVMKWTGHSDYKVMKPYIDIVESARSNAMDVFNKAMK